MSTALNQTQAETKTPAGGTIVTTPKGKATLHSYIASEDGLLVTTHIIETENSLVIVDAQFVPAFAAEAKAFADTLGKPINRLIITHEHPDHFIGAKAFGDVPIYAPATAIDFIQAMGQAVIDNYNMGTEAVVPTEMIAEGSELIDGLTFEYRLIKGAEGDVNLVILLPEIGTVVAQDIVYNGAYLFVNKKTSTEWRNALADLKALSGYDLVLAGHGMPTTPAAFDRVDAYLAEAEKAYAENDTAQGVKEALVQAFPDLVVPLLLEVSTGQAFGE